MKAFAPTFGRAPWPDGLRVLQVYGLPDLSAGPELPALLTGLRGAVAGAPIVPVPDEHLHITLDMVTDAPADAIGAGERDRLTGELRAELADVATLELQAGSALAHRTGVRLDLHPDGPLAALQQRVRSAVHRARGSGSTEYPLGVLHLTAGYATAATDSDALAELVHRVRPGHAPLTVSEVVLVDVLWHRTGPGGEHGPGWRITYDILATIPLTGPGPAHGRSE